jgi:hypothetical protein
MRYPARSLIRFAVCLVSLCASTTFAADASLPPQPDRPFVTLFTASLDRFFSACDLIFESVERPDLSASLAGRLKRYNGFAGIDRQKPLGMMFTWGRDVISHVVFLPVTEINDLLRTATFDVVGYHKVSDDQYEIERTEAPYHVLIRKDYAYIGESLSIIRAIRPTPEQLTRRMRDKYDLAVHFDLRQIPMSTKIDAVNLLRTAIEPVLQIGDDEAMESGKLRKVLGALTLDLIERAALDTKTVTFGMRIDPESKHLCFEIVVDAVPRSRMANALSQVSSRSSKFSPLVQSDAAAGFVVNMDKSILIPEILGTLDGRPANGSRLEMGFQLVGDKLGDLSLIVALHGSDVAALNHDLPNLLFKLAQSGVCEGFDENFDNFQGVVFHSMIPRDIPKTMTDFIGSDLEMIFGQGKETFWFGIGSPERLLDQLEGAIRLVNEQETKRSAASLVRGQIQARNLPELVASNFLIPNMDSARVREELSHGDGTATLKVEPITDGLKLSVDFEAGFVRLIGRDWIRQIESINHDD